ncbi:CHAP domain-containing protein [Polaribacter litorisediminis]|uniref:CHAP domain-containing protein n=1 Tax=Polaribacter litorisediminis TaxID=1908341 RepID=UPI0020C761A9|nr:CHAP domain-containing protein [Polaribacter litorisediminis]UAM99116.1 CHAP domain-containing protein [Polaribacter litorisediminis]
MDGHTFNKYGHVAIVSKVSDNEIEIVQQNLGRMSRATFKLIHKNGVWEIENHLLLGWLRK